MREYTEALVLASIVISIVVYVAFRRDEYRVHIVHTGVTFVALILNKYKLNAADREKTELIKLFIVFSQLRRKT